MCDRVIYLSKGHIVFDGPTDAGIGLYEKDSRLDIAPWAQHLKVRVNCICPGVVDTPLVRKAAEIQQGRGHEVSLPKRILQPEQIAGEVQLWHGTDDALCLPVNAHQLAERIPHAQLTMVPDAGHFLLHVKAAAVFDALTR